MDKKTVISKMEQTVSSMREQIEQNDGSILSTIAANIKRGYTIVKTAANGNDTVQNTLEPIRCCMKDLESSIRSGDKSMTAKAFAAMEKTIQDLKTSSDAEAAAAAKPVKATLVKIPAADKVAPKKAGPSTGKAAATKKAAESGERKPAKPAAKSTAAAQSRVAKADKPAKPKAAPKAAPKSTPKATPVAPKAPATVPAPEVEHNS